MSKTLNIELACATEKVNLSVPNGTTVAQALTAQALYQNYLKKVNTPQFGIFGKIVTADYVLQDHDRIELYYPLSCDPMIKRKNKVSPDRYRRKP